MKAKLSLLVVLLLFASCTRYVAPPASVETNETTMHVMMARDTIVVSDTASLQALVVCDSLGKAYLSEIDMLQGQLTSLKLNFSDNKINIKSFGKHIEKAIQQVSTSTKHHIEYRYKVIPVEKNLTGLQKIYIVSGKCFLWVVIPAIIIWIIRKYIRWQLTLKL
jgi:hypothetical protein